ncbi:Prefoldin protein, subunit 3 [Guillardia theta CCMP2712]|uniref:Prefoldin subunit 3 n=1 Tax=Guillardia theta (strain CCMP2712) TaxID=905079 RepID=L1I579_GUITC|nr:Prefoldin protein, subunit 3 [Guillardia theta CCMP2712]EKX31010.1 Prefoldin protein, subunit 3 [Guillardia theta CCMP2712]|eukprot:XP_005817990.1 Prefoldin protein, subunit 3 [Guillardia theta CCMP2712]
MSARELRALPDPLPAALVGASSVLLTQVPDIMSEKTVTTPGGIPAADFIENVDNHLESTKSNHEQALAKLQDLYSKYKFIESRLSQSKANLKGKIPEIKKTLEALKFLKTKSTGDEECLTDFELSPTILAKAKLKKTDTVCLWLGANVMMEFSFDEAENLLSGNLGTASTNLERIQEQLLFLRDQITTTEVNMARVYNHEVRLRKSGKLPAKAE